MSGERRALVRQFLERSFPSHTVADWFNQGALVHVFRVDDDAGWPRYWLAISEEALGDQDFDLAGKKLTPALVQTLKDAGATRSVVVVTTERIWIRAELP